MRRHRPRHHLRRLKSGRITHVNIGIKPKVIGTIKSSERKIFNHISNPRIYKKEFGGGLDFNKKGRLENINMMPGLGYEVELPPDYEAQYHTHPDTGNSPPSPDDVIALIKNPRQQAEIVFRDGTAFIVLKTERTKALSKLPATQLRKKLGKAFFHFAKDRSTINSKWKKHLEKIGFRVIYQNKQSKPIRLKIKPVEPKNEVPAIKLLEAN